MISIIKLDLFFSYYIMVNLTMLLYKNQGCIRVKIAATTVRIGGGDIDGNDYDK